MTREEAIRELMFAKREVVADSFIDKAYDMAISALKAQIDKDIDVPNNDDIISRHAAIELIERMKPYHQEADDIAEMIANMPSAQPELAQNLHNACTDLISRQEVIKLLDEAWVDGHEYQGWLHDEVNRLPSAQSEPQEPEELDFVQTHKKIGVRLEIAQQEIIRCKDCKNWDTTWHGNWTGDGYYCPNVDGVRESDFYCADAERRTDEQTKD